MPGISILALALAVGFSPWTLVRLLVPRAGAASTLALWGPALVIVNTAIPIGLHLSGIPISPLSLAAVHGAFAALLAAVSRLRRTPLVPAGLRDLHPLLIPLGGFLLLVLPVTRIAGIDTYKWQNLATAVQVERAIPWFVHPASLFGFTPRSYSSAQPLVLATVEIMGHTGVDWGFYVVSALFGIAAMLGAYVLGRRLFADAATPCWFAFLYVFSPVFLRYGYWATGRGLFLCLLPLYVFALLALPRPSAWAGAAVMTVLIGLAHKTGLVAAALIPVAFILSPLIVRGRFVTVLLALLAAGAGVAALGGHGPLAALGRAPARLGCLLALAVPALLEPSPEQLGVQRTHWRAMVCAGLLFLPLLFADDMYGALILLPFAAFAAAAGLHRLTPAASGAARAGVRAAAALLTLLAAFVVVAHQAKDSPPEAVVQAALFLERHDPLGPYRIQAPGRVRTQMQAYVSGCPRFTVTAPSGNGLRFRALPAGSGNWWKDLRAAAGYLRGVLELSGSTADWYDNAERVYYVTVNGEGVVPPGAPRLFAAGNVAVYGPERQGARQP